MTLTTAPANAPLHFPIHQGRLDQRADAQHHCRLHEGIYAITDDEVIYHCESLQIMNLPTSQHCGLSDIVGIKMADHISGKV